jgi:hypothetical protein
LAVRLVFELPFRVIYLVSALFSPAFAAQAIRFPAQAVLPYRFAEATAADLLPSERVANL